MVTIGITNPDMIDGEEYHHLSYHFETDCGKGRLLNVRSRAIWLAVGNRLIDFFGGSIDYQDCDEIDVDVKKPWKGVALNCPSDGKEWYAFQQRILDIKPITVKEWRGYDAAAAYKIG
jgi:hypothetical protein